MFWLLTMKHLLLILGLVFLLACPLHSESASSLTKWEYAKLTSSYRDMTKEFFWKTGTEDIREVNGVQLIERFTKTTYPPDKSLPFLFDVIGEMGWELVGISNTAYAVEYFFKRPKP